MSSGPLLNNLGVLQRLLTKIRYPHNVNMDAILSGSPSIYLTIFHYAFLKYSKRFAAYLNEHNYELYSKTDERFMETIYALARDLFSYNPRLSIAQFFQPGYTNAKLELARDLINLCLKKIADLEYGETNRRVRQRTVSALVKRAHAVIGVDSAGQDGSSSGTESSSSSNKESHTQRLKTPGGLRPKSAQSQRPVAAPATSSATSTKPPQRAATTRAKTPAVARPPSTTAKPTVAQAFFGSTSKSSPTDIDAEPRPQLGQLPKPTPAPAMVGSQVQGVGSSPEGGMLPLANDYLTSNLFDAPPPGTIPLSRVGRPTARFAQPPPPMSISSSSKEPTLAERGVSNFSSGTTDRVTWTKSTLVPLAVPAGRGLDPYLLPYDEHLNEVVQRTNALLNKYSKGQGEDQVGANDEESTAAFESNMIVAPTTGEWAAQSGQYASPGIRQVHVKGSNIHTFRPFSDFSQAQIDQEIASTVNAHLGAKPTHYQGPPSAETYPVSSLARAGTQLSAPPIGSQEAFRWYQSNVPLHTDGQHTRAWESDPVHTGSAMNPVKPTPLPSSQYVEQVARCEMLRQFAFEAPHLKGTSIEGQLPGVGELSSVGEANRIPPVRRTGAAARAEPQLPTIPNSELTAQTQGDKPEQPFQGLQQQDAMAILNQVVEKLAALGAKVDSLQQRSAAVEEGLLKVSAIVMDPAQAALHGMKALPPPEESYQPPFTQAEYDYQPTQQNLFAAMKGHMTARPLDPQTPQRQGQTQSLIQPQYSGSPALRFPQSPKALAHEDTQANAQQSTPSLSPGRTLMQPTTNLPQEQQTVDESLGTGAVKLATSREQPEQTSPKMLQQSEAITDKQVLDAFILARYAEATKTQREAVGQNGEIQEQQRKKAQRATASVVAKASYMEALEREAANRDTDFAHDAYISPHSPFHVANSSPLQYPFPELPSSQEPRSPQSSKVNSPTLGSSLSRTRGPEEVPEERTTEQQQPQAGLDTKPVLELAKISDAKDLIAALRNRIRQANRYLEETTKDV